MKRIFMLKNLEVWKHIATFVKGIVISFKAYCIQYLYLIIFNNLFQRLFQIIINIFLYIFLLFFLLLFLILLLLLLLLVLEVLQNLVLQRHFLLLFLHILLNIFKTHNRSPVFFFSVAQLHKIRKQFDVSPLDKTKFLSYIIFNL